MTASTLPRASRRCWLFTPWALPIVLFVTIFWAWFAYVWPLYVASDEAVLYGAQIRATMLGQCRGAHLVTEDGVPPLQYLRYRRCLMRGVQQRAIAAASPHRKRGAHTPVDLQQLSKELAALNEVMPPPRQELKFLGFLESKVHYLYFIAYLALSAHLGKTYLESRRHGWLGRFATVTKRSFWLACGEWLVVTVLIATAWMGQHWLRDQELNEFGRTVFSFVHWDVSSRSHDLQYVRSFAVTGLIAASCVAWSRRYRAVVTRVQAWHFGRARTPTARELDASDLRVLTLLRARSQAVKDLFGAWQVHSIFLSLAFLPWMFYYWSLTDARYYMANLIMQAIWGIVWCLVSLPALEAARAYERFRSAAVLRLHTSNARPEAIEHARSESPVSFARVLASGAAAAAAYFVPILHRVL